MIRVLIIEDEEPIAEYIYSLIVELLSENQPEITITENIEGAIQYLKHHTIDLCLLDLNLYGEDGFKILQKHRKSQFMTIVISAYREKAIDAFEHDVIDFVPKPISTLRLKKALDGFIERYENRDFFHDSIITSFSGELKRIQINDIDYLEASHIYVKAHLKNGSHELIDRSLTETLTKLPSRFKRCHRSYIVNIKEMKSLLHVKGGTYVIVIKSGKHIPVSRSYVKAMKDIINQ